MNNSTTIETIGYITKEEKFSNIKYGAIPNTLVIENKNPYPGYHGENLPEENKAPEFIFYATKKKLTSEDIFRAAQKIQKYYKGKLDIAKAELNVYNKTLPAIRLKSCLSYENILEIQQCFHSEGIEFAKAKTIDTTGLVDVQKPFYIEKMGDGIYKDLDDENYSYLEIQMQLNWEQFRAITMKIKNSIEDSKFDVALGYFFRRQGIIDIVRVYSKERDLKKLEDLKRRYDNEIQKLALDKFL